MSTTESSSISILSDLELRAELIRLGVEVGPIVTSTRKIYEKKLQSLLNENENVGNNESLTNGAMNGGGTPLRETTPLIITENNGSPNPTPRASPGPNEQGSDDDDEPSESARLLTPREMNNFRRSFKSMDSPDSLVHRQRHRRECSPPLENTNLLFVRNVADCEKKTSSAVKRYTISILVMAMTGFLIVAMFWMRERLVPIFDGDASGVEKGK